MNLFLRIMKQKRYDRRREYELNKGKRNLLHMRKGWAYCERLHGRENGVVKNEGRRRRSPPGEFRHTTCR